MPIFPKWERELRFKEMFIERLGLSAALSKIPAPLEVQHKKPLPQDLHTLPDTFFVENSLLKK